MQNVPVYVSALFILTTFIAVAIFYKASHKSASVLLTITTWLLLQSIISLTGFYTITKSLPPRFIFLLMPPLLAIIVLFATKNGQKFIDSLNPQFLTLLHVVRVPVELLLFSLFFYKTIPQLMTFDGRNFDVLSGLTAPAIYYLGYYKKHIGKKIILIWNMVCIALLFNIVLNAIFAAPFPFQLQAFDQPNIAILYFPFIWLPGCIVPLVLFSHFAVIRQLIMNKNNAEPVSFGFSS
ncbi:MAG: hypothetical protein H7296_00035 [Bacteroidia bacterium]|nr:hypothetical protein [Bacteroidia bacterium]